MQEIIATVVAHLSAEEAFERFLKLSVADGTASPKTLKNYRASFSMYLGWAKALEIDPLTAGYNDLERYRAYLISLNYKKQTIALHLCGMRVLYTALQRWGVRQDNPAAGLRAPKDKESRTSAVMRMALSPEEARKFLKVLPSTWAPQDVRNSCMIRLMLYHGLRVAEICALRSDSVDYGSFTTLNIIGKGNKPRTIALCPATRKDMMSWTAAANHPCSLPPMWAVNGVDGVKKWDTCNPGQVIEYIPPHRPYVIPGAPSPLFFRLDMPGFKNLSTRAVENIVDQYLKKSGLKIPGRSCHALRHSAALLAVMGGGSGEAISQSMGHSDGKTTYIYTRAAAQFQSNPADAVQKALDEEKTS